MIPKLVDHFARRAPVIALGNTAIRREFLDVRDVARAYLGIAEQVPAGEIVNISSGTSWSIDEVVRLLIRITGHHPEIRTEDGLARSSDTSVVSGSPTRLRRWVPDWRHNTLASTLRWMVSESIHGLTETHQS